jgi:hypothetical protein
LVIGGHNTPNGIWPHGQENQSGGQVNLTRVIWFQTILDHTENASHDGNHSLIGLSPGKGLLEVVNHSVAIRQIDPKTTIDYFFSVARRKKWADETVYFTLLRQFFAKSNN